MKTIGLMIAPALLWFGATKVLGADELRANLYRGDQPAVLSKADSTPEQAKNQQAKLVEKFKAGYARAGKPKIAMFWDRTLSDQVTSTRETTFTLNSTGMRVRDNHEIGVRITSSSAPEKRYSLTAPPRAAEFETGFQSTLRQAGAAFVDRETIIRLSALKQTKEGQQSHNLDFQTLEMSALADYAQYFAEVNFIRDSDANGGLEVRVSVISTADGEVVADVVPIDIYKPDEISGAWVATDSGFKKQPVTGDAQWRASDTGFNKVNRRLTGVEEGQKVAYALMAQLVQQFANVAK